MNLFRSDSTIVAPYERWQYYNENVKRINENKNYAENKTKQVRYIFICFKLIFEIIFLFTYFAAYGYCIFVPFVSITISLYKKIFFKLKKKN